MKKVTLLFLLVFITTNSFSQLKPFQTSTVRNEKMQFFLYTPKQDQEKYPLVVFLHGGGQSGNEIDSVRTHGLPKLITEGRDFPFYVFAPQNPYKNGLWDDRLIDKMVDNLIDSLKIDTDRIYLTGLSRGGYGVWSMAINHPQKYAAMISVCAATIPMTYLNSRTALPVWFFHGKKDNIVSVQQTIEAYDKLKTLNPDVKITIYPEANHDSWTKAFENDEVYEWLLTHGLNK